MEYEGLEGPWAGGKGVDMIDLCTCPMLNYVTPQGHIPGCAADGAEAGVG